MVGCAPQERAVHKGTMRCQSMPGLQVRCPYPTSVGVVRWVSGRASSGWGPGLGEVGEVGETDIHTAETAAYLIRCPRSKPPTVVCVWLSRGAWWGGLERAGGTARVAGGVVGHIGGCDEGASGLAGRSSPTCHDEEVRMGDTVGHGAANRAKGHWRQQRGSNPRPPHG